MYFPCIQGDHKRAPAAGGRLGAMTANEEMGRYWNEEGGTTWADEADRFEGQLAEIGDALLALAAPQPGERVLDVGCGPGSTTLAAAEAVGPEGAVLGLDVSAPLARLGEQRAADAGLANTTFLVADAQTTDVSEHGPFDLLLSRFGVMFFDDPTAAFTNLRSALRPGARVAFACWKDFFSNPWMSVPMVAALEHLPPPPHLDPDAPGPWAFADDARVTRILTEAGFGDVRCESFEGDLILAGGGGAEDVYGFLTRSSLGRTLLVQDDESTAELVEASVLAALRQHETPEGVRLPFASWLVSAKAA
jgi:SAM-dependent methyltransferase